MIPYPVRPLEGSPYNDFALQAEVMQNGLDTVISRLRQESEYNTDTPWPRLALANALAFGNQLETAIDELEPLIEDPQVGPSASLLLSMICEHSGQPDRAVRYLKDGLKHYPSDTRLIGLKALILIANGDFKQAASLIEAVLGEQRDPLLWSTLCDLHMNKGEMAEAQKAANQGLLRTYDLGWSMEEYGLHMAALAARKAATELNIGDLEEALHSIELATDAYSVFWTSNDPSGQFKLQEPPPDPNIALLHAQILLVLNHHKEALLIIDDLMQMLPDEPQVLRMQETALEALDRKDEATAIREKRLTLEGRTSAGGMSMHISTNVPGPFGTPDIVRGQTSIETGSQRGQGSRGAFGLPSYSPEPRISLRPIELGGATSRTTFTFPIVGFFKALKEIFRGGADQAPLGPRVLDGIMSVYPVVTAIAAYLGWIDVVIIAKNLPFGLFALLLICVVFKSARVLVLPLHRLINAALWGVVFATLAGWIGENPVPMGWLYIIGLLALWIGAHVLSSIPHLYRKSLRAGELAFVVAGDSRQFQPTDSGINGVLIACYAGEIDLDLRHIRLDELPAVIEISAVAATIKIRLQPQWTIAEWRDKLAGFGTSRAEDPIQVPPPDHPPHLLFKGFLLASTLVFSH